MLGYFGGDWLHVTSIESCVNENHVAFTPVLIVRGAGSKETSELVEVDLGE
jgi:hypothetical protein